jgi:hypothetical protein
VHDAGLDIRGLVAHEWCRRAVDLHLGGLVDIIGCLCNFSVLAMLLNTFQVDLKPGDESPLPDVRGFAEVDPTTTGQ